MKSTQCLLLVLAVGVMAGSSTLAAPWCAWTADMAQGACTNDAWADYQELRGRCQNDHDPSVRLDCYRTARGNLKEELAQCREFFDARIEICDELGGDRYDPSFEGEDFVHPDDIAIQNPYRSLAPGHTSVVRSGSELVIVHVTDETKVIDGVPCRVVVDAALEVGTEGDDEEKGAAVTYEPLEVTDDWYAYHNSGDVWYCGELSRNFEDGELVDLDGSFAAGREYAKPGILIRFDPILDELYRQEFALNEAEDMSRAVSLSASLPGKGGAFDCDGACLQTVDTSPMEPSVVEHKFYIAGVGFVLALKFEDGVMEDETEALACTGDSLDILEDPACGIEDIAALLEELCKLAPDAFCPDGD